MVDSTVYQHSKIIPTGTYSGGSMMIWTCFAASGLEPLAIMEAKLNSVCFRIMQGYMSISWRLVEVGWFSRWPSVSKKIHHSVASEKENPLFGVSNQSPDLSRTEMLQSDLKRAVHTRHVTNLSELQLLCKEEWSKLPPERCAGLIQSSQRVLPQSHCCQRRADQLLTPKRLLPFFHPSLWMFWRVCLIIMRVISSSALRFPIIVT